MSIYVVNEDSIVCQDRIGLAVIIQVMDCVRVCVCVFYVWNQFVNDRCTMSCTHAARVTNLFPLSQFTYPDKEHFLPL